ncbi:hypothetical protein CHLRE_14g628237v5 [Chlamydomonas reinhardtii]|uniref:GAF domain-containing protein n=1 Tax=Chlamydomonas reinhardtii TaxID=3055 RepID=A0A2K3CYG9_CHLRE|nr:uncharacterized protein CHLRE_14g628237v5 [Chlamydomonas reinhardtii]PNW73337.1 hypothetical protein CHLRE_14g628237v5 [Chlamydomonas reinhardtii]
MLSCFRSCVSEPQAEHLPARRSPSPRQAPIAQQFLVASDATRINPAVRAPPSENAALLRLLPVLASINAGQEGWCTSLVASCRAAVQCLEASHASVYLRCDGGCAQTGQQQGLSAHHGPVFQVASAGPPGAAAAVADGGGGGAATAAAAAASLPLYSGVTTSSATASSRLQQRVAGPCSSGAGGGSDAVAPSVMDVLLATQQKEARLRALALASQDPATLTAADYQNLVTPVVAFREVPATALPPPSPLPAGGAPQARADAAPAALMTSSCGGALPEDWAQLAAGHGCRHFAVVGIETSEELKGVLCLASAAAARPASWTPEALHAMAALLASHVAQAAAVLGQALPALLAATNISQVVAALGAAAAGEAEKIAHVAGQVRVAFVHQQQAPAEAVAAAAIFPYEVAVGGGRKSSLSAASQAPLSTPSALRVRRRASCELIMDRDKTGLLQLLQGRGSSVMQAVTAAQQQEDGSMGSLAAALYSAATTTNGGITMGAAVARNKAVEALPVKPLSTADPSIGGETSATELESAESIRRMLSFVNGSRDGNTGTNTGTNTGFVRFSNCADAASAAGTSTCKGHTLALAGTLLSEALSKGAAGLCVDDCAAHVQDTKSYPRDLVLSRHAPMPLALALATHTSSSLQQGSEGLLGTTADRCSTSAFGPAGSIARAPYLEPVPSSGGVAAGAQAAAAAAKLFAGVGGGGSAAANTTADGRPLLALYTAFTQTMPRPLLQAVVRSQRELLAVRCYFA